MEVNTTNYAIPQLDSVAAWADATPDGFTIHVKMLGLLAVGHCKSALLPANIRKHLTPSKRRDEAIVTTKDISLCDLHELWARFNAVCATLLFRCKMGLVIVQLFDSFAPDRASFKHLCALRRRLYEPIRMAVELRNRTWYSTEHTGPLFQALLDAEDGVDTLQEIAEAEAKYAPSDATPAAEADPAALPRGQVVGSALADTSMANRALLNLPLARRLVHRPWGEGHKLFSEMRVKTAAGGQRLAKQVEKMIKGGVFHPPEADKPPARPPTLSATKLA